MKQTLTKLGLLAKSLIKQPKDFPYRLATVFEARAGQDTPGDYQAIALELALEQCSRHFAVDFSAYLNDHALTELHQEIEASLSRIRLNAPFDPVCNTDDNMATLLYLTVRALKPEVVVETGVAYGNSSAHILKAMQMNGAGRLYSIDHAPLEIGAENYIGALIPGELQSRWELHRGTSRHLLAPLLESIGKVDLFIHDSLHTYSNMIREYRAATPHLQGISLLLSDDIQRNQAFGDWTKESNPTLSIMIHHRGKAEVESPGMLGLASFASSLDA